MSLDLHIYNTLSRQKEVFKPLLASHVGMYVCGPTVYGEPHLGHARPSITFDIVFRYLQHLGLKVRYVRNITDAGHLVDDADEGEDKIAKKARLEQLEPMEVPAGGIGEFVKTDEEIEALEREEANLEFGEEGIAYFNEIAGKMAGYGRFGDDSIAHIETGEIVVPKALIENNPRLKEQIFAELREAGIEDPEQYKKFLQSIIPRTKMIFTMIKKYVKGAVSFIDVLSYLEPFLIYQDDITYKQYESIQKFLETLL